MPHRPSAGYWHLRVTLHHHLIVGVATPRFETINLSFDTGTGAKNSILILLSPSPMQFCYFIIIISSIYGSGPVTSPSSGSSDHRHQNVPDRTPTMAVNLIFDGFRVQLRHLSGRKNVLRRWRSPSLRSIGFGKATS